MNLRVSSSTTYAELLVTVDDTFPRLSVEHALFSPFRSATFECWLGTRVEGESYHVSPLKWEIVVANVDWLSVVYEGVLLLTLLSTSLAAVTTAA